MSYLKFTQNHSYTGRTKLFVVENLDGHRLGEIRWWTPWRRYTFQPANWTTFDVGCLLEITEFIKQLMEERKDGKQ